MCFFKLSNNHTVFKNILLIIRYITTIQSACFIEEKRDSTYTTSATECCAGR